MKRKVLLYLLIPLFIIFSCENSQLTIVESSFNFTPERVGELHNLFVERAINEYIPNAKIVTVATKAGGEEVIVERLEYAGLIEYLAMQPEIQKYVNPSDIKKITDLFCNLEINDDSPLSYVGQLNEYLNSKVKEIYGVTYDEIMNHNSTRSTSFALEREYAASVYKSSSIFWNSYNQYQTRSADNDVIIADTIGALWGCLFGGVGSILAGGMASLVANSVNVESGAASDTEGVEIWKCNPKYI